MSKHRYEVITYGGHYRVKDILTEEVSPYVSLDFYEAQHVSFQLENKWQSFMFKLVLSWFCPKCVDKKKYHELLVEYSSCVDELIDKEQEIVELKKEIEIQGEEE